ncbi:Uncharacterised protein [Salmonella enterica subsp. enterica serovar Bovismorbificans]|uniref:Uncharacterized protein n=1 Tax=Salmonella enterica subsp. enterica serovar Bovismorbificans TaxID=58097 RepID=A0A655BLJ1_SALET|nr:Uncharacterised protein [Salmonella enterica subsp. enterica serovar Bovismorbificans]
MRARRRQRDASRCAKEQPYAGIFLQQFDAVANGCRGFTQALRRFGETPRFGNADKGTQCFRVKHRQTPPYDPDKTRIVFL